MSCSKNCKCRPGVVAFIFVPGIMGSRLQNKLSKELVWDPASGLDYEGLSSEQVDDTERLVQELNDTENINLATIIKYEPKINKILIKDAFNRKKRVIRRGWSVKDFVFASPKKRKKMLVNDNPRAAERDDDLLEVASGDSEYFEKFTDISSTKMGQKISRGWGEVLWDSYGPFLHYLERQEKILKQLYPGLSFPVFAVGYNWMLSNEVAGKRIKKKLMEFKAQILEDDRQNISEEDIKFIIISHSMGGIASRSALMLSDLASEVEGVIHCAMPTYGSPDTYRRMRCGQDGITKLVIGKNAAEITAILAYSQGGLELLPNQLYRTADNNPKWLFYAINKKNNKEKELPINYGAEIYEFYKQYDVWYRLIQPDLLAPGLTSSYKEYEKILKQYIYAYEKRIDAAKLFHQRLENGFHPTTTLIYSDNPNHKSYDYCCWWGKTTPDGNFYQWKALHYWDDGSVELAGPEAESQYQKETYNLVDKPINLVSKEVNKVPLPPLVKKSLSEFVKKPLSEFVKKPLSEFGKSLLRTSFTTMFTIAPATAKGDGTVHIGSGKHAIAAGGLKKIPITATEEHQNILKCPNVQEKVISEIKTWLEDIHHKMGG